MSASAIPPDLALDDEPFTDEQLDTIADLINAGVDPGDASLRVDPLADEPWRIDDLELAEWAMRHVATIDDEAEVIERQHREWREKIERWHDGAMQRLRGRRAFFEAHLVRFALDERARTDGRVKSVVLPSGKVATTEHKPRPVVTDPASVVAWAREYLATEQVAEVVKVEESPRVAQLAKLVRLVEVVDLARVTLHCGDVVEWPWFEGPETIGLADGVTCPACGGDALVGRMEVLEAHLEARGPAGEVVAGLGVEPGSITTTVRPT